MKWLLSLLFPLYCEGCGIKGYFVCPACIRNQLHVHHPRVLTLYDYDNPIMRSVMLRMKQFPDRITAALCAQYWGEYITEILSEEIAYGQSWNEIVIVPIPARSARIREYGFNQTEVLAHALVNHLPNARVENVLRRTRTTRKQALLKKDERLENMNGVFAVGKNPIHPRSLYLIIDDIVTSGATLDAAGAVIAQCGARYACAALCYQSTAL